MPEATHNEINWGGVVKGVAIVAGVAVAAVVGAWLLGGIVAPAITGAVTANSSLSALAYGAHSGLVSMAHGAGWLLGATGQLITNVIPTGLANILGLSGQSFAQAAAVNHVAGVVGAAGAGAVAAHAAIPYLDHTHLTQPAPVADTGVLATQSLTAAPALHLHDLSHITHHAAEHGSEHVGPLWSQRFTPRPAYGSYADNVIAAKEERRSPAQQPAASFTEQLNADRAELDTALAK